MITIVFVLIINHSQHISIVHKLFSPMYAWNKQTCKCSQIFFVLNQGCDTDKAVICSNASRDDARSGYIVHVISSSTYKNLLTWLQKGVDQILKCHSDRTLRQNKLNILFDTTKIKEMFI